MEERLEVFLFLDCQVFDRFESYLLLCLRQFLEEALRHLCDTLGRFAFFGEFGIRGHKHIFSRFTVAKVKRNLASASRYLTRG